MTHNLIDLTGRTFGGLTVLERAATRQAPSGATFTYWRVRCVCGNEGEVASANLRRGHTRSCGQNGCRGRYPRPEPAETLHRPGNVGTTAALLRASVNDDHLAVRDLVVGLDEDDDVTAVLLHLLRIASTALTKAEGGVDGAHAVVDSLAAMDRRERR